MDALHHENCTIILVLSLDRVWTVYQILPPPCHSYSPVPHPTLGGSPSLPA